MKPQIIQIMNLISRKKREKNEEKFRETNLQHEKDNLTKKILVRVKFL